MGQGMRGLASGIREQDLFYFEGERGDFLTKEFDFLWKGGGNDEKEAGWVNGVWGFS